MNERFNKILKTISEHLESAQKTYKGQKRSDLKDSDFLFPETRSFPIVTPQDVPDAISNYGRMKGKMTYDAFLRKLYNKIKNKPDFVAALPEASKQQLGLRKSKARCSIKAGDRVRNINKACMHYGSEGIVQNVETMPDNIGYVVSYMVTNDGSTWKPGEILRKTHDQLAVLDTLPKTLIAEEYTNEENNTEGEDEEDSSEHELMEYKTDFLEMNIGSLRAIMEHAKNILESLDNPSVKENLTESWLQGKIAITEDYMRTIHDFVKYVPSEDDTNAAVDKPGLWENIRRKKLREGKDYKPARPGDKDRPDPDQWKKLQKDSK